MILMSSIFPPSYYPWKYQSLFKQPVSKSFAEIYGGGGGIEEYHS